MTVHRFFCDRLQEGRIGLSTEESHHAATVLRLSVGHVVELFDGNGRVARGRIGDIARTKVVVDVRQTEEVERPVGPALTLVTALPRTPRQQFLLEKCTELGVARIIPARFARSTVRPKVEAVARWRRLTIEAGKQSGAVYLPVIEGPGTLEESLATTADAELRLVATPGAGCRPVREAISDARAARSVAVWIGPEGGLTPEEQARLAEAGAEPVTLGRRILRIETAALVVAAAVALAGEGAEA
jgi:16S rRNA (uracil1498-N3)-methyltransferase